MVSYIPTEKGQTIREPSVANLLIDSADRTPSGLGAGSFTIQKQQALQNGFFTRIGVTEVVLEWGIPNIAEEFGNRTFEVDVSGTTITRTLSTGFYNVSQVLNRIVTLLNTNGTYTFAIVSNNGQVSINCTVTAGGAQQNYDITLSNLSVNLGLNAGVIGNNFVVGGEAPVDLRYFRYLDFVSDSLTYLQDVKDGTTNQFEKNVLCRFYLSYDNPCQNDALGFPILFGYQATTLRRIFNPAKQIKWEPNLPIGNLKFEVFGWGGGGAPIQAAINAAGQLFYQLMVAPFLPTPPLFNWLMTLQISEV
jgi:hypothetical protein